MENMLEPIYVINYCGLLKINSRNNNNMIITDGEETNRVAAKKTEASDRQIEVGMCG